MEQASAIERTLAEPVPVELGSATRISARHRLDRVIDRIGYVCPIPAAARRLVEVCATENVHLEQVAEVVATDPALSTEVMKIANSAAYGLAHHVTHLTHAVAMIGLREIRGVAAGMSMLAAFRSKGERAVGLNNVPLVAGSIGRTLALRLRAARPGEAFLASLLCEVGALACAAVDGEAYAELFRCARGYAGVRRQLEIEEYGVSTQEIGAELLRRNGIPERIACAVQADLESPSAQTLDRITSFARASTWVLLRAGKRHALTGLTATIGLVAERAGLALPASEATDICLASAGLAADTLQKLRR